MKFAYAIVLALCLAPAALAQSSATWKIDNLTKIGGNAVEVLGSPKIVKKAVEFDGSADGIFLNTNPIEGFSVFTIEAVFRPDGGNKEQRWFHIQQTDADNRVLLEIRVDGDDWFLDTFIKSGDNRLTHYAEKFHHPLGKWYHVALVFDGKEMRHYVDGKLELAGPLTIAPFGKGLTSLGVRQNKVHWFKGAIKKVRITDAALAPKEFMKK